MKKSLIISKFAIIVLILFLGMIITSNTVLAANLSVNINFNGKTIEMTSETPEMTYTIENLLPGESEETILTISNIGTRSVNVTFIATIENDEELADILNIKVIKLANNDTQKEDEEIFNGKYSELINLGLYLDKDKSQVYKIITSLPEETGNEFQKKECKIKLSFRASGIEDSSPEPVQEPEPNPEPNPDPSPDPSPEPTPDEPIPQKEVATEEIKQIQTGESHTIYYVVIVLGVALVIFIITFCVGKKKKDK